MRDVHKRKATVSSHSLGSSCDGGNSVTVHLVVFRHLKKTISCTCYIITSQLIFTAHLPTIQTGLEYQGDSAG